MRSFGGPDTYKLPIHGINRTHFETASRELDKFDVVLPLSNISQLPFLLGMVGELNLRFTPDSTTS